MKKPPFLHEHEDFNDLLEILSRDLGLQPQLIEKDYWLMHCLFGLSSVYKIELKGGTSLSKGFKIIDRFSEDIDIKIDPPGRLQVKFGPNHDKDIHVESRRNFFDWLQSDIKIPGIISVERDVAFDDEKMRSAGIRLRYQSHYDALSKLKAGILLEVGFDRTQPNEKKAISSWCYDKAIAVPVSIQDNRAIDIPCYLPQYTFVEKLQALSTKYRQQREKGNSFPPNFLRHYYDLYKLLELPTVLAFLGTKEYYEYKDKRFRGSDNRNIATNDAFILKDPGVLSLYESEYKKGTAIYFRGQVPFSDILERIKQNIGKL